MSISSGSRPKILFITSHWPLAPAYGAQQRVLNIGRLLERFADVSWVIAPSEMEDPDTACRTRNEFDISAVVRPFLDLPRTFKARSLARVRHEFDRSCMQTDHYVLSESDRALVCDLISKSDVVWIHTLRTAHWFRIQRWPHSVMDIDDLPSTAYRSTSKSKDRNLARRLRDRRMAWLWKRREGALLDRFDILAVCSEEDKSHLNSSDRIHVIPNGANPHPVRHAVSAEKPLIGFIGNCGFKPNEEGIKWFIRDVWPSIKRDLPSAQFRLVGASSEKRFLGMGPDINGLGWLSDPAEEVASWSVMIAPIMTGAGTRLKIADGFARKCPVVSTRFGALGYEVKNGRELMLADEPEEFASACVQLARDPALGQDLAERAYQRFLKYWTWESFQPRIETAVQQCLSISRSVSLEANAQ